MNDYNVVYIGAGPATIFSVLEHRPKDALIIEKGKSVYTRSKKEVVFGFAGAGCWSDSKLICFGRSTQIRPTMDFDYYADKILKWYNHFADEKMNWIAPDPYEIPSETLKLIKSKNCHVGTDRSQAIFHRIEDYIKTFCPIHFEEEVTSIEKTLDGFLVKTNKTEYRTKKVMLGTGNRDKLLIKLLEQFNLPKRSEHIQIGVRVETTDEYFKDLMDKFYDFKISMNTPMGRWRTFCVNGKTAHVAVERDGNYVSANGHAYANREPNHLINFALLGQLQLSLPISEQVEIAKEINSGTNKLLCQEIDDFLTHTCTTKLKFSTSVAIEDYRFGNLWDYLPTNICEDLELFIREIKRTFLFDGHFFAPEINIVHPTIQLNERCELISNLYVIGDVGVTRSIVDAGVSGIMAGESL